MGAGEYVCQIWKSYNECLNIWGEVGQGDSIKVIIFASCFRVCLTDIRKWEQKADRQHNKHNLRCQNMEMEM